MAASRSALPVATIEEVGRGDIRFEGRLRRMEARLDELPLAAAGVFEALEKYHDEQWGRGAKIMPATFERWPNRKGPLELTSELRDSMTKTGAPGAIRRVGPLSFEFGTDLLRAQFLQRGTRKMTKKPVLRSSRVTRMIAGRLLRDFLRTGL